MLREKASADGALRGSGTRIFFAVRGLSIEARATP